MRLKCPGCMARLQIDDESYNEKVLVQCPECLFVFLARSGSGEDDKSAEAVEDATLLTSDFSPSPAGREMEWDLPGAGLTVIQGDSQGLHKKLESDQVTIGRKGADMVVRDRAISRAHCRLEYRDGSWRVVDLGSKNGVFVNGQKVEDQELHHLDEIGIGQTLVLFSESGPSEEDGMREQREEGPAVSDDTRVDETNREKVAELPSDRKFFLEFMGGDRKGRSIEFDKGRMILGRGEEADVRIDDEQVSRKHASIEVYSREQIYIADLASQNGTWLNGMKIRNTRLMYGDLVRVGNTVLKFIIQDTP